MVENFITNHDKLEFRQIVLAHVKDILKLSQVEFRGGYHQTINHGSYSDYVYIPDTRDCYVNAVLSLCEILTPYFDKDMQKIYDIYYDICTYPGIVKFKNNKFFVDWLKDVTDKDLETSDVDIKAQYISEFRVFCCRILFRDLNKLMHRQDYLREAVFGEGEEKELIEVDK